MPDGRPPGDRPPDPRWPTAAQWLASDAVATTEHSAGLRVPDAPVDVAVVGVPAHATSLSPTAAHRTPAAVREALRRLSTYAVTRGPAGTDVASLSVVDLGDVADPDADEDATGALLDATARRARLCVALGGDNSITYAVALGAAGDRLGTAGLVTLDAHHDLREGRSNGSPVRRLVDAGLEPRRIAQVGIADWANSASYTDEARRFGITVLGRAQVARRGIGPCVVEALDTAGADGGPVHVDLDVDVCDRAVAPGCPASLPGGLSAAELLEAAYLAGRDPRVASIDVTEVDATADERDGRTVRLAAMCLLEAAAGLADRGRPLEA